MKQIKPYLLVPNRSCRISGKRYRIPTLFDWYGRPVPEVNAYLRHLAYAKKAGFNTIKTYARPIYLFWVFMAKCLRKGRAIDWKSLDNETIRVWKNELEEETRGTTTQPRREINSVLRYRNIFFDFLYWASRKKLLDVPMDDPDSPAIAEPGVLSINEVGVEKEFKEFLPVPSSEEICKVMNMIAAHSPRTARRNLLMFRWASEAGLRNTEIRTLTKALLPSRAVIATWRRKGTTPTMAVVGKGTKRRSVEPPLSLLDDTYDYLDDISEGAHPSWSTKGEHIFPGEKHGAMALTYVSALFAKFFALAGSDSHLHRARAYYVYKLVEGKVQELAEHGKLDELHVATILRFVADRVGHEDVETLRHYIRLAVIRLSATEPRIIED